MSSIQKVNGKWKAQVCKVGFPRRSKTFSTRAHAISWANSTEHQLEQYKVYGYDKTLLNNKLSHLIDRYQATKSVFKRSYKKEIYILRKWKNTPLAQMRVGDISTVMIVSLISTILMVLGNMLGIFLGILLGYLFNYFFLSGPWALGIANDLLAVLAPYVITGFIAGYVSSKAHILIYKSFHFTASILIPIMLIVYTTYQYLDRFNELGLIVWSANILQSLITVGYFIYTLKDYAYNRDF